MDSRSTGFAETINRSNPISAQSLDPNEQLGVLVTNLGTPDSPVPADVRRYLGEFLWDPRVVEMPRPIWWLILHLGILTTRPRKSAAAYARVWTQEGSPLLVISKTQVEKLQLRLTASMSVPVKVVLAMRYGTPSIRQGMQQLCDAGIQKILVLPMYPQYSATTTASTFDAISAQLLSWRNIPELRYINRYYNEPVYIQALADRVRAYWADYGRRELLLMSFHGIPQKYVDAGDPYYIECCQTGQALAQVLDLGEDQWRLSFQSRLGAQVWLTPYTDHTLRELARKGVRSVQVLCPGFSVDCLETLDEIAVENKNIFLGAGGEHYDYIPCLNASEEQIALMTALVRKHSQGWIGPEE